MSNPEVKKTPNRWSNVHPDLRGQLSDIFNVLLERTQHYHPETFEDPEFKKTADEMQEFIDIVEANDSSDLQE